MIRLLRETRDEGFTLIELLVVIIVIGILSAIAIPLYLRQKEKSFDAGIQSDMRSIARELETYYVDNQDYPTAVTITQSGGAVTIGTNGQPVAVGNGSIYIVQINATGQAYCIQGTNPKGTDPANGFFYISSQGGLQPKGTTGCGSY